MPAGVPRRVRGPFLELWGEFSTCWGALLLLQNQRQQGVAGNREMRRCLQATSVPYTLTPPTWTHEVTVGRGHCSFKLPYTPRREELPSKILRKKTTEKESVLSNKQRFYVQKADCASKIQVTTPHSLQRCVKLSVCGEEHGFVLLTAISPFWK